MPLSLNRFIVYTSRQPMGSCFLKYAILSGLVKASFTVEFICMDTKSGLMRSDGGQFWAFPIYQPFMTIFTLSPLYKFILSLFINESTLGKYCFAARL